MKLRAGQAAGWGFVGLFVLAGCGHDDGATRSQGPQDANVTDASGFEDAADVGPRDADVTNPVDAQSAGHAIEFGRTLYGHDVTGRADAPSGGTLFSVWTKIPDAPTSYPWNRGNMDVYVLYGPGWHMRCLTGNMTVNSPSSATYNANTMIFAGDAGTWVDDYSLYVGSTPDGAASATGWVWAAWQVVVQADRFVVRQWLKYGIDGDVFLSAQSSPTFVDMRATLVADRGWTSDAAAAWVPGDATHFDVGRDNGHLVQARMMATSTAPSLDTLDGWARATGGDGTAWADFRLGWIDGAPDLSDRSGHGRDLVLESGGTLYEGDPAPSF